MKFSRLSFRPGIVRETTEYTNEGGWYQMDKVRFRYGLPEKINGWQKAIPFPFLGTCRGLMRWTILDGTELVAIATNQKLYVAEGFSLFDITPLRETTAAGTVTFSAAYSTLDADITASADQLTLADAILFPDSGRIKIGSEEMSYNGISGDTLLNLSRGENGTTAASHSTSDPVGCASVTVSCTDHGAMMGDFVTFVSAASLGGNMTAAILNQEYRIVSIVNADSFVVEARTVSSISSITVSTGGDPSANDLNQTYVYSTSSDSGSGGASAYGRFQINVGQNSAITGTGWGAGVWGRGGWGSSSSIAVASAQLRVWSLDNFGEDLICCIRDGGIYYLDVSLGLANRAVALSSIPNAVAAPTVARQVLVSDRDRHVIAFGCDDEFSPGIQDPLLIRFSSQENAGDWESSQFNTAGFLRLGSGSGIVCAVETKQEIIVFTDVSLHSMQYIGPPFTFGINLISYNITIASQNSAVAVEDSVYWMGSNEFYTYNGMVQDLQCPLRDYVFSDINLTQISKVVASANPAFSEVWWFYPSANSNENDRYVVFNYQQGVWSYGNLPRTAWDPTGSSQRPIAASPDNYIYDCEIGADDGSTNPPSPIHAFIQSSGTSLDEGNSFVLVGRMIPDINFRTTPQNGSVTMTVKASNFPGGTFLQQDEGQVSRTVSFPVNQFTEQLYLRLRGRSFFFRIESNEVGVQWRLGTPRLEIRTDGRR